MLSNEIFLKKRNKLYLEPLFNNVDPSCSNNELATFLKNIANIGFLFSPDIVKIIKNFPTKSLKNLQDQLVPILNDMVGNNVNHQVFYPNFPKQVMEASEAELFINAMIHYISFHLYDITGGEIETWLPEYKKEPRETLDETIDYKLIKLGTKDEFDSIFTNLLGSNASISEFDKNILRWFIAKNMVKNEMIPENIPQKEQLVLFVSSAIDYNNIGIIEYLNNSIKTATDVLRIAVSMSDGDISLAEKTKFKKFNRKERRLILSLLNNVNNPLEDMYRNRLIWLRLGEIIHPGEYYKKYKNACESFNTLRNVDKFKSFNGKVDGYLKKGLIDDVMSLLITRPGELVKRLDYLLRNFDNSKIINYCNFDVFEKVSTPVLLRLYGHLTNRDSEKDVRVFYPKGSMAKMFVKENDLTKPLSEKSLWYFISLIEEILIYRFKELEPMGNVYLDERLKNIKLPFSDRSSSESLTVIPRASKFDFGNKNILRFFIHWANIKEKYWAERIDLDLSADFYDENWKNKCHISYTNLREFDNYHSGDITDGGPPDKKTKNGKLPGVSEFIDVNLNSLRKMGIRYIVPSVFSFTNQPYSKIPYCFFGWMERDKSQRGEIFEASTVKNKINLTAKTELSIPMLIDVYENKIYWMDLSIKNRNFFNNIESNRKGISTVAKGIMYDEKPSVYDLLKLHSIARSSMMVDNLEEADISFTLDNISENLDSIKSDYMQ